MNQNAIDQFTLKLQALRMHGKTIADKEVRDILGLVKNIYGVHSDELAVISKAADRIFNTDKRE